MPGALHWSRQFLTDTKLGLGRFCRLAAWRRSGRFTRRYLIHLRERGIAASKQWLTLGLHRVISERRRRRLLVGKTFRKSDWTLDRSECAGLDSGLEKADRQRLVDDCSMVTRKRIGHAASGPAEDEMQVAGVKAERNAALLPVKHGALLVRSPSLEGMDLASDTFVRNGYRR